MMQVQSALLYKSEFAQRDLVFEATTKIMSNTEISLQSTLNSVMSPQLIWENGRSHFVFSDITPTTGGRKYILTYDERYGIGRPIGFGGALPDSHHRPAIIKNNNKLYIVSEINHGVLPMRIWVSDVADEAMYMDFSATTIGTTATYPNLHEKNGIFTILNQTNDVNAAFVKNTSGDYEGSWTTEELIATRQADEDELYVTSPSNLNALPNEVVFVIVGRNDDTVPPTWFNKYIIRAEVTASGITYFNWRKTFSTTSLISAANMATHYQYYSTGSDTAQGYLPVLALDKLGNFYDISGDGSGGYDFVYMISGQSTPTVKAISLPGGVTILSREDVGGEGQSGGCLYLMAESPREIYAFFRVDEGGDGKIYAYRTTDLGDTWTFHADVFDDISGIDFDGFIIPNNTSEIPGNRNFICVGTQMQIPEATMYIKRVAWGEIQTDDIQGFYDAATAYTASEYDALMLRSYYVEAGKVTNTGTVLNTCIDQSPSAQDATSVGSPVMDSETTPTFLSFDGTNDALQVPTTGLTSLVDGTIIVVAKPTPGSGQGFVTFSRNSSTPYLTFGKSSADITRYTDSGVIVTDGSTAISDDFHIFVYLLQNDKCAVLQFVDGELQFRTQTTPSTLEGRFTGTLGTIDRVQIGRLFRNTTNWYDFDLKHCAIMGSPMNTEQLQKSLKYLANKYSISLVDHYD